jgi:phosphoribosylanthranilate isomerase
MIVQIYEIQTPEEARCVVEAGVHHIGSVIPDSAHWQQTSIRDAIQTAHQYQARASLIPLFFDPRVVFQLMDWYQPDILHFCDALWDETGQCMDIDPMLQLQDDIRKARPDIGIMRTIPIPEKGVVPPVDLLPLARAFETLSDWLLIDTWRQPQTGSVSADQPVNGFIGITGKPCDWDLAAELVRLVNIPVILAGGITPENVYEGIMRVRPSGIDSCTGTNALDSNGNPIRFKKDINQVKKLISAVRQAEADLRSV